MEVHGSAPANGDVAAKLRRMLEVSVELNSTAELDTLLTVIMDAATELTGAEAASVLLLDPRTRELYFAATSRGSQPGLVGMRVPLDSSIAGGILRTEQPSIVSDVRQHPRHHEQIGKAIDHETRSLLGVPMLAEGHRVGVLEAINKRGGDFTQEDIGTLTSLASLAAVAIHRAGLIAQLRDAHEQLAELDRLKSNFIAIASHELRTPLAIILGYANLLKRDVEGEELDQVFEAAMRLRTLMEGMFNLQYIDAGKSQLSLSRFCLARLVREVTEDQRRLTEAKEQTVRVHLPKEDCQVTADRESVRLVLVNLISNAFKFTPGGGNIEISATKRRDEVWVSVRDNGIGIPQALQARVFNRFYQVEPPMTRYHGGLGLGLAIASELLDLQNGRIWVESEADKGSEFTFALPLSEEAGPTDPVSAD